MEGGIDLLGAAREIELVSLFEEPKEACQYGIRHAFSRRSPEEVWSGSGLLTHGENSITTILDENTLRDVLNAFAMVPTASR